MFIIDKKIEIINDKHKNLKRDIENSIIQSSSVSPIIFFIYISGVFDTVNTTSSEITSILFMDDLKFWTSGKLIKQITISLEITGESILRWRLSNIVTYNIAKTEAILYVKSCYQKSKKEIAVSR